MTDGDSKFDLQILYSCLARSVPEINCDVAGTLNNKETSKQTEKICQCLDRHLSSSDVCDRLFVRDIWGNPIWTQIYELVGDMCLLVRMVWFGLSECFCIFQCWNSSVKIHPHPISLPPSTSYGLLAIPLCRRMIRSIINHVLFCVSGFLFDDSIHFYENAFYVNVFITRIFCPVLCSLRTYFYTQQVVFYFLAKKSFDIS